MDLLNQIIKGEGFCWLKTRWKSSWMITLRCRANLSRGFFDSLNKSNPLNLLTRERFVRQLGDI
jgi:hypothetical protein